jgi:hypothetical protein
MSRSQSVSSDRPRLASRLPSLLTPPTTTSLAPAYIGASAASQIVTTDHDAQAYSWFTEDGVAPSGETAVVSPASLKLVNSFLDQLLYNFLCVARSTSLSQLRPAVLEVLKPTLAREAITGADQELHEYLGDREDEEPHETPLDHAAAADWDIERVWKQTRLRCMVYSSLGDVEEDDEDMYMEQEQLNSPVGTRSRAPRDEIVSPPVAIFLTSILEFIGEQTLIVAGQAAYQRSRAEKRASGGAVSADDVADRVVVLELDTEKVALNATLGRLWRTWRKRLRSSTAFPSRALSRDSPFRRHYQPSLTSSSRRSSFDHGHHDAHAHAHSRNQSLAGVLEEDVAANIPLPMSDNDVAEIEVPGLADRDASPATADSRTRHRSVDPRHRRATDGSPSPVRFPQRPEQQQRLPSLSEVKRGRRRSRSLPTPAVSAFVEASDDRDEPLETPMHEEPDMAADDALEVAPPTSAAHGEQSEAQPAQPRDATPLKEGDEASDAGSARHPPAPCHGHLLCGPIRPRNGLALRSD